MVVDVVDVVEVVAVVVSGAGVVVGIVVDEVVAAAIVAVLELAGTVGPVLESEEQANRSWVAMTDTIHNDRRTVIRIQVTQGGSDAT